MLGGMLSKISINNTNFTNNRAWKDGGAMKWIINQPYYYNVIFKENKAIYGNNIASIPLRMNISIYDIRSNIYLKINSTSIPEIENVVSGDHLYYRIEIRFVDFNDVIISSLDSNE